MTHRLAEPQPHPLAEYTAPAADTGDRHWGAAAHEAAANYRIAALLSARGVPTTAAEVEARWGRGVELKEPGR